MGLEPVVGVMGGGSVPERVEAMAEALGRAIAEAGWVLLNGGRAQGVMAASARGAAQAGGRVVGVLPDADGRRATEHLDVQILTGLGDARNVVNVLSSDVVVACPGGDGTLSEVAHALKADRPVVLLAWPDEDLPPRLAAEEDVHRVDTVEEAVEQVEALLDEARPATGRS